MSTFTAKVLEIMVETGHYKALSFMCNALKGWTDSFYGDLSPKTLSAAKLAVHEAGFIEEDVMQALYDVQTYVRSFDDSWTSVLINALCEVANKRVHCEEGWAQKILTPLYLDWDNRPKTKQEVIDYMEKHYVYL